MTNLKLSVSATALSLLLAGGLSSAQAADIVTPERGCGINGSVMAGYMYNWQDSSTNVDIAFEEVPNIPSIDFDGNPHWETPFAEGAALFTCHGLNVQGDFAWYDHQYDVQNFSDFEGKDDKFDQTSRHIGAALFYREPDSFAFGISGSRIEQDTSLSITEIFDDKNADIWRVGVFGEVYLGDVFTLGASAHYYSRDQSKFGSGNDFATKDEDGFELAAWGRFYPTPNLSLTVRGDLLLPNADFTTHGVSGVDANWDIDDGWAISGEAEYLVWDRGLTLLGGARYAERSFSTELSEGPISFSTDSDIKDFQVYAGLKFYFDFSGQKTLVEDHRTGAIDNTSVFHEKLPEIMSSAFAGVDDDLKSGIAP